MPNKKFVKVLPVAAIAQLVEPLVVVQVVVGSSPTGRPWIFFNTNATRLCFRISGEHGILKRGTREARGTEWSGSADGVASLTVLEREA